jgi:methionine-rich copper-binding protein CopC
MQTTGTICVVILYLITTVIMMMMLINKQAIAGSEALKINQTHRQSNSNLTECPNKVAMMAAKKPSNNRVLC